MSGHWHPETRDTLLAVLVFVVTILLIAEGLK